MTATKTMILVNRNQHNAYANFQIMDKTQSQIIEKFQEAKLNNNDSDDDLLELLDDDDSGILSQYRESRIEQLNKEFRKIDRSLDNDSGYIQDVESEKQVMEIVTSNELVIVHFYQPNFNKCNKMMEKLALLAEKHLTIKVLLIKAESATFLTSRLNIKVLPFVVIYKNGKELDRLVGFEQLGNDPNDFKYESLETLCIRLGVINRRTINLTSSRRLDKPQDSEESDLDL